MGTLIVAERKAGAIGVITNPRSRRNRRLAPSVRHGELTSILGAHGLVRETTSLDALFPAVKELCDRGVRYLVSDGGDGALHWLVNAAHLAVEGDPARMPVIVPTLGGTMNFVAHVVGVRERAPAMLRSLVRHEEEGTAPRTAHIPTLALTIDDDPTPRLGFCAALAGLGPRFFDEYYRVERPGTLTLLKVLALGVLSALATAPGLRSVLPSTSQGYVRRLTAPHGARVRLDEAELPGERCQLNVGAVRCNLGGVLRLFPLAGEGRLHVIHGDPSLAGVVANLPRLLWGSRLRHGVSDHAAQRVEALALGEPLRPIVDGEPLPALHRVRVSVGPQVVMPVGSGFRP